MLASILTKPMQWYYMGEIFYVFITGMTKISILFFYLRIFTTKSDKTQIYIGVALCTLYIAIFFFVIVFQCSPVPYTWKFWDGEHQGTCMDINAVAWAMGITNICLDIYALYIPIPRLLKLTLSLRKKIYAMLMVSVGSL
jgi:hypothetical protein